MTMLQSNDVLPARARLSISGTARNLFRLLGRLRRERRAQRRLKVALRQIDRMDSVRLADIGLQRHEDVAGWQIPVHAGHPQPVIKRYYDWLASADAFPPRW